LILKFRLTFFLKYDLQVCHAYYSSYVIGGLEIYNWY